MKKCVDAEIEILQSVADLTPAEIQSAIEWNGFLPVFKAEKIDLANDYAKRTRNIGKYGYGIYAKNHMFRIDNGKIVPVLHPDEITLSDLIGYEREKKIILDKPIVFHGSDYDMGHIYSWQFKVDEIHELEEI